MEERKNEDKIRAKNPIIINSPPSPILLGTSPICERKKAFYEGKGSGNVPSFCLLFGEKLF